MRAPYGGTAVTRLHHRLLLAGCLLLCVWVGARPRSVSADEAELALSQVRKQLQRAERSKRLDAETRDAVVARYAAAVKLMEHAQEWEQRAAEFEAETAAAPKRLEAIRAELNQPAVERVLPLDTEAPLSAVEQLLTEAEAEQAAARASMEKLQGESERRAQRRTAVGEEMARVKEELAAVKDGQGAPPAADEDPNVIEARETELRAEYQALMRELVAYQRELASYDARTELLAARIDLLTRRSQEAEQFYTAVQNLALDRRRMQAELDAREAQRAAREVTHLAPVLQRLAEDNQALAERRSGPEGVAAKLEAVTEDLAQVEAQLVAVRDSFRRIDRRVKAAGLSQATGRLLRKQYEDLPDVGQLRRHARARQAELADAEYELILLEEDRADAGDIDGEVRRVLETVEAEGEDPDAPGMEAATREVLTARRDLLDAFISDHTAYFDRLVEYDAAAAQLIRATSEYRTYIEERILWVRSVRGPRTVDLRSLGEAVGWFADPQTWGAALRGTLIGGLHQWVQTGPLLLACLLAFSLRPAWRHRLVLTSERVGRPAQDTFRATAMALALTLGLALPVPLVLWLGALLLEAPTDQADVALASAAGLKATAVFFFTLELVRHVLREDGLGQRHFGWPAASLRFVRRHLRWLTAVALPAIFFVVVMDRQGDETWNDTVGRLAFMVGMLAFAVFNQRIFHRTGSVIATHVNRNREGLVERLRLLWYPMLVVVPLAFVVLALLGYFYTAVQLQGRLYASLVLCLGLALLNALLYRWLFIARQRLAWEQAEQRRAAARAESDSTEDAPVEDTALDIPAVSAQTQQMFRSLVVLALVLGLYGIWLNVLPALNMLNRIEVWPHVAMVRAPGRTAPAALERGPGGAPGAGPDGTSEGASVADPRAAVAGMPTTPVDRSGVGADGATPVSLQDVVTLADVGLAIVILAVTVVAMRNLPGLLEMMFLKRLPMDAGARYALSTVIRYAITIVGVTTAFGAIGIGWAKMQWLAAALTFGLAFGLQEIFANFVSGLIILAERPIRVGDTVTVADITGTVSRIRMRATTITDWDRKELIVPNKTFITDQLINWSLSDPVVRLIVPVGVAYGSDIAKTESTLLQVARDNPLVRQDPHPRALFLGFGESSLDFELRVHISNMEHYFTAKHELHKAVDAAFREAGIEIAFPQRDLHVRSLPPAEPQAK